MLDFDPDRTPPAPRDAATVVVLRDAAGGPEVLCVKRHGKSGFLGGAVVFPGGKTDPADHRDEWEQVLRGLGARALGLGPTRSAARAYAVTALRELLEEAALCPVKGLDDAGAEALRHECRDAGLLEVLRRRGFTLDASTLVPFARWVTPAAEARRFDTRFYLMAAPPGQRGAHDRHEITDAFWATPAEVLARWEQGDLFLAPPTSHALAWLAEAGSTAAALARATTRSLDAVCPCFVAEGGGVLTLPGDPLHPEPAPTPPPGEPTRFVLRDGRFVPERVTR